MLTAVTVDASPVIVTYPDQWSEVVGMTVTVTTAILVSVVTTDTMQLVSSAMEVDASTVTGYSVVLGILLKL